ncbi:MAG TPA: AMP-binding protein [Candidatus Choladousia intestinigallinarum]|nr:AMP-binding protein [Candidatus Choladousia intestinigallinarum]
MNIAKLDSWVKEKEGIKILDRQAIESLQLEKLNRLLEREYARQGFYRNLPRRLNSLKELENLPFTTEQDLKEQGNRMLLVSQSKIERVRSWETSGTTGPAKRVFYTARDNDRTVSFFSAGLSELIHWGEKALIAMPFTGDRGLGELIQEAVEGLGAVPVPAGNMRSFGEMLELLDKEKPDTFIGPPVLLLSLLRMRPKSSIKRGLVSGDACPPGIMKAIEERLGTRLYPHYGSREMGLGGAVTCPAFQGMHLRENDIIGEIVDEKGKAVPEGEWGELTVTLIEAGAMPLIRYRTGDISRFLPGICPCGCCLRRLDSVSRIGEGREMEELDDYIFQIPWIVDYRISRKGEILEIEGLTTEKGIEEKAGGLLPGEWKGRKLNCTWKSAEPEDEPCYRGKRRIEN